jgi:hypothetical protein
MDVEARTVLALRRRPGVLREAEQRLLRRHLLALGHGRRPGPDGDKLEPGGLDVPPRLDPQLGELRHRFAHVRADGRGELEHRPEELGLEAHAVEESRRHGRGRERLQFDDEELLLEPDREG